MADSDTLILARIGSLVAKWNACETLLQALLLAAMGGNRDNMQILTTHMGTTGLCDALRTLSTQVADQGVKDHTPHLIKYFEILREYRNYYIHGFKQINPDGSALFQATSARGAISISFDVITINEIDFLLDHLDKWIKCINSFLIPLWWPEGPPGNLSARPLSSLEKPPLPKRLTKSPLSRTSE